MISIMQEDKQYDLIVIGSGAAGIIAAIVAARNGKRVLLLEKLSNIAAKLKATGGGRCNLTNTLSDEEFMEKYLHKVIITETSFDIKLLEDIYSYTFVQKIIKRTIDYIAIILLLIPTLLAIIYSFFKIKKESPGSVIFQQIRVGHKEKEFNCIKIRSMHLDSEIDGPRFSSIDDPRTFPWGKTIRSTKIDELLQLWNVFKGEMHLVGPRPERPIWTQEFKKSIPYYNQRHTVSPGITGLAQIKYHYGSGEIDAKAKLEYDLYYIKNWSLKLELSIIWETIIFIFKKFKNSLIKSL